MSSQSAVPASVEYGPESGRWTEFHPTPATVGDRLKTSLAMRGRVPHWLFKQVHEDEALQVKSYSTLQRYLNSDRDAPIPFLEVAADLLGVRRRWLVLGEGEPTDEGETRRFQLRQRNRQQDKIDAAIDEVFPHFLTLRGLGRASIREAWKTVVAAALRPGRPESERVDRLQVRFDTASAIGEWFRAGLDTLVLPYVGTMSDRELHMYVTLASQAVVGAVPREAWWTDQYRPIDLPRDAPAGDAAEDEDAPPAPSGHGLDSGRWTEANTTPARVHERLALALSLRDRSSKWLHEALLDRGVDGVKSPSTVYRYLKPESETSEPPMHVLDAASQVLGFRRAWLILGEGEPTETGEERRAEMRRRERQERVYGTVAAIFPYFPELRGLGRAAFAETYLEMLRAAEAAPSPNQDPAQAEIALARALASWLMGGLDTLVHPYVETLGDAEIHQYVTLALQSLMAALPPRVLRADAGGEVAQPAALPTKTSPRAGKAKDAKRATKKARKATTKRKAKGKAAPAADHVVAEATAVPPGQTPPPEPDFYDILGVSPNADAAEIRRAYRALKRDLLEIGGGPETIRRRALLDEIQETLTDAARRRRYDQRFARVRGAGRDPSPPPADHVDTRTGYGKAKRGRDS